MSAATTKKTSRLWWDFRYIWMFISTVWVFFLLSGLVSVWQERWVPNSDGLTFEIVTTSAWVRLLATVLVLIFIGVYLEAMYRMYFGRSSWISDASSVERWKIRTPLLLVATLLVFLPVPSSFTGNPFAQVMMFVVIAWTLTSPPDRAFSAVITSTVTTALILAVAFDGGVAFNISLYSLAFGFFTSGYVINRGLINELRVEQSRVRDQAVTEERYRLARDLHDTVGHSMTQITLKAELARRILPDDPARAADELQQIEKFSRALSTEVRRSIAGEVTLLLDRETDRSTELLQSMDVGVTFSGDIVHIPEHVADVFAWCLREGVMNVIKHSGASRCEVAFTQDGKHHILTIADNGRNSIENGNGGRGIHGMTRRTDELGGDLALRTTDSGHELVIRIPA